MKFWFGRKAARGVARPFLFRAWQGAPQLGDWPRSYEAQLREAYLANPVAQRAVRLVAECVAWAPVYGMRENATLAQGEKDGASTGSGRAVSLVPPALLETVAAQLLLHGNAFVQILCDGEGAPAELFALRPERVKVEPDAGGWPAAYLYKAGEAKSRLPARDALGRPSLVHLKAMHPLDDHYGLGCLGAAAGAVAVHNAAAKWNKALLDNAARPSGALISGAEEALSAEQFARLREEIEAQFAGTANAGRPMLLEGGLRWQAMGLTPADMDFAALKAAAAREIALAFGVPPMLLGLPGDSTYANYREANRALWRLTVLPLAGRILAGLAGALAAWWPGLRLEVDVDQVTALAQDRERLWAQISAADFLTREEKREMLGLAPEPSPSLSPSGRGARLEDDR
ncbi:MAG: phage portal protein [Pseudomonadota bacterium]|nr:phage portal protein [Pseudomonadota bacterium]